MIEKTLGQIAHMIGGEICDEKFSDVKIKGISTDSRTIDPGELYIPLVGEVFDGRIFIKECESKGAKAFFIDDPAKINKTVSIPYIRVEDTKKALQDLAAAYRDQLTCKVIAITGSNGKTTTKDLLHKVLSEKYKTQKTCGNLNNDIGVPKTVLSLDTDTEVAIIELGTDNFGDISLTSQMVKPHISMITNIGDSHLHNLKSRSGILKAKLEILEGMDDDGIFIYNIDDPTMEKEVPTYEIKQKVLSFGTSDKATFRINFEKSGPANIRFSHGDDHYQVPLMGQHNIYNAAAVVMISQMLGLDKKTIDDGFAKATSTQNRTELLEFDGFDVLDDSYKSNPQSLLAGLETAYMLQGYKRKIVCLADMLELGEEESELHRQVGSKIDSKKIDFCLFYGPLAKEMYEASLENFPPNRSLYFEHKDELIEKLKSLVIGASLVFVKGSHGMHMEEIIEAIKYFNI
ncbi:UDP-N-acetylmuramoyl-tripeptide--D-alanyl-D-alanine ligase [Anaerococcus degeneri]|uniref:UDP-N-acetylmuramoyl-tripeptide--D-alanyl-D-alanine ligase n=1 Tax=Anaerococcus degeneri TaxID=361500 RepID=A0ABS7Z0U5_9FIRM|nr:UDP-N-acetylmuramoyl-tripeptide--D-alanyl-D-alanine ligase [Anaerococcus degeneri]MBP2014640.1 UDP-N-acetylmuramoyl-tripeptide--D-alanyl-D-alanine ligase [Anaerococcus degeneri]MCA2096853.1 UDP-N-acetylmuramoyl-tripeptide--D-alanyl-D-alanine ligase [Anaerococcus degeneri]